MRSYTWLVLAATLIGGETGVRSAVGVVERASLNSGGVEGDNFSVNPAVSPGGRFVAFESDSIGLVPGDTNAARDIFVRDSCRGAPSGCTPSTIRVSRSSAGAQANSYNLSPAISADGRFVAFESEATNLVIGDTNERRDVFLRDTCAGASPGCTPGTTRVSVASSGAQSNEGSGQSSISADGRYVVFQSGATNFPGDTNNVTDVFVRDTCHGAPPGCVPSTIRASVASSGAQGSFDSFAPTISRDGRFVAFASFSTNLVPGDTNTMTDVFVRDTCLGTATGCTPSTIRASVAGDGAQADNHSLESALGADGRFVAFRSQATNLVLGDANLADDIFLRDTCLGAPPGCVPSMTLVSVAGDGTQSLRTCKNPALDATGRIVVFSSDAANLVPGDTNGTEDVFVRDTCASWAAGCTASTIRVSVAADGTQGRLYSSFFSPPAISADGRFVVFDSEADNLVPDDTNGFPDVFLAETGLGSAGAVPDGGDVPGVPVTLQKAPGGEVTLDWGPSCTSSDTDYEVYEGEIAWGFSSHEPRLCSTAGATSATIAPAAGSAYYLVVPRSSGREGSYGKRSDGSERTQGALACLVQQTEGCP